MPLRRSCEISPAAAKSAAKASPTFGQGRVWRARNQQASTAPKANKTEAMMRWLPVAARVLCHRGETGSLPRL